MPKKAASAAYLIAIRQLDETDNVYAILAKTESEALKIAGQCEPAGPAPRHVGSLGAASVKRLGLKPGEARII
ncbi:hypothetical protein [Methylobacterium sp. E-045]|uniref:hypothetical protein n=1 Tax=Methylobacterium sp. E-045 TaxID=2836575 RepID=UPI001FB9EFBF|nr:hypothetical protein [Methylobacterium sp. E-045]